MYPLGADVHRLLVEDVEEEGPEDDDELTKYSAMDPSTASEDSDDDLAMALASTNSLRSPGQFKSNTTTTPTKLFFNQEVMAEDEEGKEGYAEETKEVNPPTITTGERGEEDSHAIMDDEVDSASKQAVHSSPTLKELSDHYGEDGDGTGSPPQAPAASSDSPPQYKGTPMIHPEVEHSKEIPEKLTALKNAKFRRFVSMETKCICER